MCVQGNNTCLVGTIFQSRRPERLGQVEDCSLFLHNAHGQGCLSAFRLRVVSSFPSRRSSRIERREITERAKSGARTKKARGGKVETTDNPLLKNLRGRWWPQYSDWPVWAFLSTGLTT